MALQLRETCLRLDAEIIAIGVNRLISSNYQHPYEIICQYIAPDEGVYHFNSEPIWTKPSDTIIGNPISVYVDANDYSTYIVDISYL